VQTPLSVFVQAEPERVQFLSLIRVAQLPVEEVAVM
jgi:hypothetical protein